MKVKDFTIIGISILKAATEVDQGESLIKLKK